MNAKNTPLAQLKGEFGNDPKEGKKKLVDAIIGLIDHGDEDKDSVRARLLKASNRKLLRLRANSAAIKEKYGTVEKLVSTVADKLGRAKDGDFVSRLKAYTPSRLLDLARSLGKEPRRPLKMGSTAVAPKAAAPAKKATTAAKKKAPAKKPAAKGKAKSAAPAAKKKAAASKKASAKK
jgi:pyruvate/2-oxoglutarate dehydrogenase complex dihydrolipoamide acyltransferase (E2) component